MSAVSAPFILSIRAANCVVAELKIEDIGAVVKSKRKEQCMVLYLYLFLYVSARSVFAGCLE
jgi:hypothetical protein